MSNKMSNKKSNKMRKLDIPKIAMKRLTHPNYKTNNKKEVVRLKLNKRLLN